ncbi:MAG: hypothetical protein ACRDBL_09585 [Rhabdaerophilum sp.]
MPDTHLTAEEIRNIVQGVVREELATHDELLGRNADTAERREELRRDAEFVRSWRQRIDKGAETIGKIVLTAIAGAIIAVFAAGTKLYLRQ